MSQIPLSFWTLYNSDDSWLPFILPLLFWSSSWIYYRWILRKDYSKWYKILTLHHVVALTLAFLSLYWDDDAVFHERIGIFWSMPYFMIDILDCLYEGHLTYTLHGAISLGLGFCNYNIPLLLSLRMNSKAIFMESSSILLYQVKQNRNPALFALFAITFTLCRIVWIPVLGHQLLSAGLDWFDPILLVLGVFYGIQLHWWIKIIKILKDGASSTTKAHDESAESASPVKSKKEN